MSNVVKQRNVIFLFVLIMIILILMHQQRNDMGIYVNWLNEEVQAMTTSNEGFNRAPLVEGNCSFNTTKPSARLQLLVPPSYSCS